MTNGNKFFTTNENIKSKYKEQPIQNKPNQTNIKQQTQNEINKAEAQRLADSGCYAVCEGAKMPTNAEATEVFLKRDILFIPGKASNAGGVATSALEMGQNSIRSSWTFDEVDAKLKGIMINIYYHMKEACEQFDAKDNFVVGANIAGFMKVADAMMAQGIV